MPRRLRDGLVLTTNPNAVLVTAPWPGNYGSKKRPGIVKAAPVTYRGRNATELAQLSENRRDSRLGRGGSFCGTLPFPTRMTFSR